MAGFCFAGGCVVGGVGGVGVGRMALVVGASSNRADRVVSVVAAVGGGGRAAVTALEEACVVVGRDAVLVVEPSRVTPVEVVDVG